jgi:hypothetical protein
MWHSCLKNKQIPGFASLQDKFLGLAATQHGSVWKNAGFTQTSTGEIAMGNKIVTEADRKRTPRPVAPNGVTLLAQGRGQRLSLERGSHTRSKKNPGKRAHSG